MAWYHTKSNSLFIHVPKCYGGSIVKILRREMGFRGLSGMKDCMDYYMGTLNNCWNRNNITSMDDLFIFTFIRNPIDRYISGCNWVKINPTKIFNSFINKNVSRQYIRNALVDQFQMYAKSTNKSKPILYRFWHIIPSQYEQITLNGSLQYMSWIGLTEYMDTHWIELGKILISRGVHGKFNNITDIKYWPKLNKNGVIHRSERIYSHDIILKNNTYKQMFYNFFEKDIQLYQFIWNMWHQNTYYNPNNIINFDIFNQNPSLNHVKSINAQDLISNNSMDITVIQYIFSLTIIIFILVLLYRMLSHKYKPRKSLLN